VGIAVSRSDHGHDLGSHLHDSDKSGGRIDHDSLLMVGANDHHTQVHSGSDHTGIIGTWPQVDFTGSSLADIEDKSHASLTEKGVNTHSQIDAFMVSKASVGGLASLNASGKVVQDPANATATPTALKIPIADGSGFITAWVQTGASQGTICAGDDARLSDDRTAVAHAINHVTGASDEIDGDKVNIDWNPTNSTPITAEGYSDGLDDLTSILNGMDTAIGNKQVALGYTAENVANKNQNSGYCGLDAGGKVATTQLPDTILGALQYKGTHDCSTESYPDSPETGDYYVASVQGTISTTLYRVGDWLVYDGSFWGKIDNSTAVSSVAGKTGAVTLSAGDVGLGNVTNDAQLVVTQLAAANGVASLDASMKVVQEPASKAQASGMASLDINSLVIQNPANATATQSASKIPISNLDGDLDDWVTPNVIEIDANLLDIQYVPFGYTRTLTPSAALITQFPSHFNGISDKLAELEARIAALE
jgi:hypothetical protein